ncbi:MAG: hypothetical protein IKJ19_03375 [Clostridia bacterium]|nr:hypothetical protein [Clostridia bacterium]
MSDKYQPYIEQEQNFIAQQKLELDGQNDKKSKSKRALLKIRECAFCRFFIVRWKRFKHLHPKGAELVAQFTNFLIFSCSVTVWQFLVMLFLPYAFKNLAGTPFVWPEIELWKWSDGTSAIFGIFNEPVLYDSANNVKVGGGLGNFIAFEIAVFTAQCINFPLQRNITFKSHGNPWYQALWYFIGWVLVSLFTNALWGFINIFCVHYEFANSLTAFIKTMVTSTISMIVFFFVFKIIFNDSKENKEIKE